MVDAILYAVLAALVGIAVVAVGGGGIKTMSRRWEAVADRYDQEKPRIAEAARNAPSLRDQARQAVPGDTGSEYYGGGATATRVPPADDDPYRQGGRHADS